MGVDPPILRVMAEADVAEVVAVQEVGSVITLASVFPQDRYPFPREAVDRRWREEIGDPGVDCFVVLDRGSTVVGFAALRDREILHFGIAPQRWGTGTARRAHDALLDVLRERGAHEAWLWVFTGNARARAFYERAEWRAEWRATGERSRSAFAPRPELLRYERRLGPRARPHA